MIQWASWENEKALRYDFNGSSVGYEFGEAEETD